MKVLCVEDNEADALLLSRILGHSHRADDIVCVERFADAQERLAKETFDVILLDLSLPDAQGLATVRRMRALASGVPIVVLTGVMDESLGMRCVQAGAQDYLVKGKIDEALLERVIAYSIERQRVEQELITHREHLQELVQDRTAELAKACDEALESARIKAEFMSNMSHEIRTPLNAVIGMTELLLSTDLTDAQQNYAKVARRAGESLLRIINDILDFSKMESGRMLLEKEELHFSAVMKSVVELLAHQASSKGIALTADVSPELPDFLKGDGGRLQQVLINLVGNAIKFTQRGEVRLTASKQSETRQRIVIEFRVADTGIGLSEKDKQKLFQPFTQADSSVTRKFGGTGLGLVISKKLVELMGGRIGLESVPGQGSTFWFTIPFAKNGKKRVVPSVSPQRSSLISAAPAREGFRILVADDNEFNRILAQEQLSKLGYNVDTVADGAQALSALGSGRYPLVLMDCRMPELDGYQTTAEIRKKEASGSHRTIVIAMTANVLPTDYQRTVEAGMDDYLTKPVKIEHLKNMLDRWLPSATPQAPVENEIPVDLAVLRNATDGNDDSIARLTAAFFTQSEDLFTRLAQAIADKSAKDTERLAHCLAGSSICFGATALVRPLRQMEHAARDGELADMNSLFAQARAEFARVKEYFPLTQS